MKFTKISQNVRNFGKFSRFCIFRAIHPPESLIFLRNYWCFRDPAIFAKILISTKKVKICEKITFFHFCYNFVRKLFFAKMGPGAPKTPKKGWNCIGFIRPGASGPRGTKKPGKLRKSRKTFCVSDENPDFYAKSWKFLKNHHFALSRNVGIPCRFCKVPAPFSKCPAIFTILPKKSGISPF